MKKSILFLLILTLAGAMLYAGGKCEAGSAAALKTDFPKRPVEMVIPFGAGGASDIFARQYAQLAEKYLGKPITAINKGGAGTVEGMTYAYNAPADGYTILEITPSLLIKEALKASQINFRENFEPLLKVQADVQLIGVAAKSPFKTFEELRAFAKENPKKLKIGGLSPGGLDDYMQSGFSEAAGIEWTYVPYKSGSEIKAAVLGGELDVYQDKLISFLPLVASGDIRPLAVLNDTRLTQVAEIKDLPCSVELGINFTQGSWRGFAIRKGVPADVKAILIDALQKAYEDPGYKAMEEKAMTNIRPGYAKADDFAKMWDAEYQGYVTIFTKSGLIK